MTHGNIIHGFKRFCIANNTQKYKDNLLREIALGDSESHFTEDVN